MIFRNRITTSDAYYYTFYDVMFDANCATEVESEDMEFLGISAGEIIKHINEWRQEHESVALTDDENKYLGRLFAEFIIPGAYHAIVEVEKRETKTHGRFWSKLYVFVDSSLDRYVTLLKYYDENKTKLMNQIANKTTTTQKSNDTPQGTGDFSDDEHVSYLDQSEVETKTDGDTPMARLREIMSSYKSVYQLWYNEFKRALVYYVIEGAN